MRPSQILSTALLCSSAVAWPSLRGSRIGAALEDMLLPHKRDAQAITLGDDSATTQNPNQIITTSQATARTTGTTTGTGATQTGTNTNSGTGTSARQTTGTNSGTATTDGSSSTVTSATTFDPRLPPGGISMITPNPRSSTQYYKIGNYVTFAWNYTSLSVTPTAIDILATCTKNQATYTLAANQTVNGSIGGVIWDTKGYQASGTVPLLTETYEAVTTVPKAGYLGTFAQFTFGMYSPQPYVPLDQYVCVTCSGALSSLELHSLTTVGVMAGAAVLGGTWFVGGLSAII